jgi:hypothetical protein
MGRTFFPSIIISKSQPLHRLLSFILAKSTLDLKMAGRAAENTDISYIWYISTYKLLSRTEKNVLVDRS